MRRLGAVLGTVSLLLLTGTGIAQAADTITINGETYAVSGTDVYRSANTLIRYTENPSGTNPWGFEAAVVDDKITEVEHLVGGLEVPTGGYVKRDIPSSAWRVRSVRTR